MSRDNVHIALLRGINVGGRNRLPMKSLVSIFEEAGCTEVRTHIQSGNVIFMAAESLARRIPRLTSQSISEQLDLEIPVVTRSAKEFRDLVRANPFPKAGADANTLHVVFLADPPSRDRIATLDQKRSPPDEFVVRGREVYLCCPRGVAQSKLTTTYFDSRLGTTSTARNWRTTLKLLDLANG